MDDNSDTAGRIKALVERLRHQYRDDPNVTTDGWGTPSRSGALADEVSIIFFVVVEKLPGKRGIRAVGSEPIPAEIEGFPTDVKVGRARTVGVCEVTTRENRLRSSTAFTG